MTFYHKSGAQPLSYPCSPSVVWKESGLCYKQEGEEALFKKSLKVLGLANLIMYYEIFELKSFSFLAYPKVSFVPCNGLSLVRWVTGGHKIESTVLSWSHS